MSKVRLECSCGAVLEIDGWLIRDFKVPAWWLELHGRCGKEQSA